MTDPIGRKTDSTPIEGSHLRQHEVDGTQSGCPVKMNRSDESSAKWATFRRAHIDGKEVECSARTILPVPSEGKGRRARTERARARALNGRWEISEGNSA